MSIETGYPNPIVPGEVTAFRITLQNSNTTAAVDDTTFTNTMPVEITVAGGGLISYTCTDGGGGAAATDGLVTAVVGSNTISLADSGGDGGGTVPQAGASSGRCDIVVEVTSTVQSATHTNTIPIGGVTGNDGIPVANGTQAQQSVTVLSLNNPSISKLFSPDTIVEGDETTRLRLRIDNRANDSYDLPLNTATDTPAFGMQDVLPAGLQVANPPNVSMTCSSGGAGSTFSPSAGDTTLTIIGGAIPADAYCDYFVDLVGTAGGGYSQSLVNTVNRTTQFANQRGLVPPSNASDTLTVHSALQVSKAFSPTTVRAGEQATLTITLHNDSPLNPLTGVVLTENDIRTSGSGTGTLTIDNIGLSGCGAADVATINSNHGFTLGGVSTGTIAADGNCVVTITYTAALGTPGTPETFTDSISEGDVTNDQGAVSQPASHSVTVVDELVVTKSRSPSVAAPGNPVRYQLRVYNYSGGALSNVRITDSLPAGMLALTSPAPSMSGGGCSGTLTHDIAGPPPSTTTPHFTFDMNAGSGPSASSCTVTFWAMLPTGAAVGSTHSNQIGANGVCDGNGSGGVCNAAASGSVTVTAADPVTVSKSFNPNSASEGTVSQLTVTFSNVSAQTMTGMAFTDNLPVGSTGLQLRVADPPNASNTCGGTVTANAGDASISMTGGTIPARANGGRGAYGTCELTVNVVGAAGNYTNVLPAGAVTATQTFSDSSTTTASSPGPVQATLSYASALSASKSFSPSVVQSGGSSTVAIRLGNTGTGTLNNVSVTDPLPAGLTVANPANAYTTCGGATSITATSGASTASMSGAVIPASGECEFLFDVASSGSGDWVNTIPAGNITADGGVQNVSAVAATLTESSTLAITVTNNTAPNSLTSPGETSVLTINLLNNGTQDLTGIDLTDYFTVDGTSGGTANGMVIAATPNALTTCGGGVVAVADGTNVALSGASLTSGSSCTVTVNVTTWTVGTIQDVIPVGAITTDQGATNVLPTTTSLSAQANIGVEKEFIPSVVEPGERARLRLTFINPLALPVANLAVLDMMPAGVTVPAGANPTTTCSGATVTSPANDRVQVANGNLPAASGGVSATCVAEIDVVAAAAGTYTNVISADDVTGTAGGAPVSNPSPASDILQVRNAVTIGKSFSPNSVTPGETSTLTITLTNPSTIPLTAAALTDNLPANLVVALTPNAATTCGGTVTATASATSVSLAGGTIPDSGSCQIQVDVLSNISGTYTNTIPASSLTTLEGITNEEPASDDLVVSHPPTVAKQFSPPVIPVGGTSTLTIVIGNDNAAVMTTTADFVDTLPTAPGQVQVAGTPNASTTCTGALVAGAGATSVTLNSGATIPAGGCSISVDVTGNTVGTHINNIPAGDLQTSLGNNLQPANASLEISALGYISGRVFQDNNPVPNGSYEFGTDTPLSGVTINLRNNVDTVIATTTTDALGNYLFSGLAAGTYSVEEPNQPSGTVNGITSAGSIVGSGGGSVGAPTAIATTPSRINTIVLGDGGAQIDGSPDNDFAEVVLSSISGTVFLDYNNNGIQNGADTAIPSVTINLSGYSYGPNGVDDGGAGDDVAVASSTTTDASGDYSFSGLAPGVYTLTEPAQPTGTANGITTAGVMTNGGTAGTASGVTTLPSVIQTITLPPGTAYNDNDFAEIPQQRSLYGQVFLDYNNNGVLNDPPDHGIGTQTINLTGTDINGNPVSATTTTASDGSYAFTGLPAGTYTVTQPNQPSGTSNGITSVGSTGGSATGVGVTPSVISNIDLTGSNTVSADNDFAEVPGAAPDLAIAKTHTPASLGEGSSNGYYTITPSNIGTVDTSGTVTIVDTLPAGMTVASAASGTGWSCAGAVGASTVTCTSTTPIAAGSSGNPITLFVTVANGLAGQILTNTAVISGGGEPPGFDGNNTATDPTTIASVASVAGHVWHDNDHDRVMDGGEPVASGWTVELLLNGVQVGTTTTDAAGAYSFTSLAPGSGYQIRFRDPATGTIFGSPVPNESGNSFTDGVVGANNPAGASTADLATLDGLTLLSGANVQEQSLPLDPAGVIYDAVTGLAVAGATVELQFGGGAVAAGCLVGGNPVVTGADGLYQFLLTGGGGCPGNGTYTIAVTPPAGYLATPSTLVPPCGGSLTVGAAPDPAVVRDINPAPGNNYLSATAGVCPATSAGLAAANQASAQYYFDLVLTLGVSANVVNNHIPLDPVLSGAIVATKTTPKRDVVRGDLVPYTLTFTNTLAAALGNIDLKDQVPPGFKYRSGTARIDGVATEPTVNGRELVWAGQSFTAGETKTITLMLVVGAGVGEGEYTNQAWAENNLLATLVSNIATATVRVTPDPTFDCSDLIGKVFDDQNANGYQDEGEPGIPNVRVVTVRGLLVTTDDHGRFHVACADVPHEARGSNFIMKLDERSLPTGYRITTENPRVVRLTRGKLTKLNFGATIHRVVRLDLSRSAFEAGNEHLKSSWMQGVGHLVETLKQRPSVLRVAYAMAEGEPESLVRSRMEWVIDQVRTRWEDEDDLYPLEIETEFYPARKAGGAR